jgi:hypothetical protein
LNRFRGPGRTAKAPHPIIEYPWVLDADIIASQDNLENAEDKFDHKLTNKLYADRATWTINRAQDREEGDNEK